jgi:hypothetical protein
MAVIAKETRDQARGSPEKGGRGTPRFLDLVFTVARWPTARKRVVGLA